jgi:hypothetical protein
MCLLLCLLFLLCELLLCLLDGLCTKLSPLKVEATLTNLITTAFVSSLSTISSVSHCLCYLCLYELPLPFLGGSLLALASSHLCQVGWTLVPITRSSTNILAASHADKNLWLRNTNTKKSTIKQELPLNQNTTNKSR